MMKRSPGGNPIKIWRDGWKRIFLSIRRGIRDSKGHCLLRELRRKPSNSNLGSTLMLRFLPRRLLNRIDPSYQAQIVVLLIGRGANHYVCSFKKEGRIFIMDYGTPYRTIVGVHGPFNSLEEYKVFFEKNHPTIKSVQAITYLR